MEEVHRGQLGLLNQKRDALEKHRCPQTLLSKTLETHVSYMTHVTLTATFLDVVGLSSCPLLLPC
jgi:hypothetical protein